MRSACLSDTGQSTPQSVRARERVALRLPPGYFLDRSDPDILVLRRQDRSFVASFSASGTTQEGTCALPFEGPVSLGGKDFY
jgi:hypothetical protein